MDNAAMAGDAARLDVQSLSKTFGTAKVLDNVALSVSAGEIHGVAGQNGSGKSTLVKILTGFHQPDPGGVYVVDGVAMRHPVRWREVHAAGVSVVHQDLGLLDQLTVAENVCVGGFPTSRFGYIDRTARDRVTRETLARLGVDLAPHKSVGSLTAAERAEVAIARAMRDHDGGSGLIILDESTRALTGEDLARIHALLGRIATAGSAVLIISHNLPELLAITDRMTILRDGRVAGAGLVTRDLSEAEIARRMLGAEVAAIAPRSTRVVRPTAAAVEVSALRSPRIGPLEFSIAAGEVLGLTGVPGNGYEEIPYLMTGATRAESGQLRVGGKTVNLSNSSVSRCIRAGVVLVPERRDRDGLAYELSVRDNISLPALRSRGRPWYVAQRWQREEAKEAGDLFDIRPRNPLLLVKQLSGGNQQKVLLAKWMALAPALVVLHEPTQAVDVGARQDILASVERAADNGASVLLVSSEPEDLALACDRVLILDEQGLSPAKALTTDTILEQIYAQKPESAGSHP
ncbi:ribose transport system ATP-binding protein [Antricoccus suffuscus]|uniref:Ribose transport system ATP-binding protein n=1 Tax=Antricoccus suffuscus TaxID=1629062 RepID=A0A2T1A5X8_9ACTN|nr:sugar ABC transporter ATP-binding protein [Antricoccus suffuscus]PRZ44001.1 ribose transport system ATP-binding protein [Antricoccus suffuscus]